MLNDLMLGCVALWCGFLMLFGFFSDRSSWVRATNKTVNTMTDAAIYKRRRHCLRGGRAPGVGRGAEHPAPRRDTRRLLAASHRGVRAVGLHFRAWSVGAAPGRNLVLWSRRNR